MKKINLFLLIAILVFTSCGNSTKEFTEIGETVKKFHLAPLVANIEDIYVKKVKDKKGREQEVVYKMNADCKFAYDLTKINFDAKNKILTLPTCEVTVSPDYSGDGPKYISGGNGSYDIEVENQFKKKIKEEDLFEKLKKGQYDKKAFEHAKNLLTKMLKNFTDQNIKIVPNKEPMKLKKKSIKD